MKNFIKKLCPLFLGAVMLAGSTQSVPASEDNTEDPAEIYIGCDEYEPYNYVDENGKVQTGRGFCQKCRPGTGQ